MTAMSLDGCPCASMTGSAAAQAEEKAALLGVLCGLGAQHPSRPGQGSFPVTDLGAGGITVRPVGGCEGSDKSQGCRDQVAPSHTASLKMPSANI